MATDRWNDLRAFLDFVDAILLTCGEGLTLRDALELWDYESPENARKVQKATVSIPESMAEAIIEERADRF